MRRFSSAITAALLSVVVVVSEATMSSAADPTFLFSSTDPEMNTAIKSARSTLEDFLNLTQSGGFCGTDSSLKVAVPYGDDNQEHIWMGDFQLQSDGRFEATVGNDPVYVTGLNFGDRYAFGRDQISDWMYWEDGHIHGAYTLRVLLPQMPAEQADEFRTILAPLP